MSEFRLVKKAQLMDAAALSRSITRIAHEIIERNKGADGLVLIGIRRRGIPLATRIAGKIEEIEGKKVPVGKLDISFYRDDLTRIARQPVMEDGDIGVEVEEAAVVLVDDVIYTGRTVRAAIDAIFRHGRPDNIRLAVMIDRGLRELPFRPDFVGKNIPTSHSETVRVSLSEIDGEDSVTIWTRETV